MAKPDSSKNDNAIRIRGARVHNLKNISVDIPRDKLVVITGLSGSGKSSLAFDTVYAEAERRFVESLSAYARQFLGVKDKPDVDSIEGLSPAIAIDQKSVSRNPRSTVGTITEIYDYMRILYARVGIPHCPECGRPVKRQSVDEIIGQILRLPKNAQALLLAPVVRGRKGEHKGVIREIQGKNFLRVRVDDVVMRTEEALAQELDPQKKHSIEVVVDRLVIDMDIDRPRLADSLETALKIGKGLVVVEAGGKESVFSEHFACPHCGISLPEMEPRLFSFNSPYGACPTCTGIGHTLEVDPNLVFPNKNLTLAEGAIQPWAKASHRVGRQSWYWWMLENLSEKHGFSLNVPIKSLPKSAIEVLLYGDGDERSRFEGIAPNLKRRWKETDSEWTRAEVEKYMRMEPCPACKGQRLRPEALGVRILERTIAQVSALGVEHAIQFFSNILDAHKKEFSKIVSPLVREILGRLGFLLDVGLDYITLERESTTLSGGEAQRVRLATQIGSRLTGVTYVLDEPSIGLHSRDHWRLIETLKKLRDLGNTIIVVEHDRETMKEADWVIDLGPGAGKHGGLIIFEGTPKKLLSASTLTGHYLSGRKKILIPPKPVDHSRTGKFLTVKGASGNNLKNIDARIPLGRFVCVGGVSGSGKSTLVNDTIGKALMKYFYRSQAEPAEYKALDGLKYLDKVVIVDQSPIGRTPRSNPATYTGAFSFMRDIFSKTQEARARGYKTGRFSFNVKGGRCEACEGQGVKKIEMYFLPDIYVECEECKGKRYNQEALSITYNGKNIAEVLDVSIEEANNFFKEVPAIKTRLETLVQVGLGYMQLGQSATTLSGGEAQRVKLATELSKKATGNTLYILDEPTTGLHFDDTRRLLEVLRALVDKGNSVLVIEHNTDVLKNADWIIELGPEGGAKGGQIVAEGMPKDIARNKKSPTGEWLKRD